MREVSLYVNNIKLDLFNDEQITVTSTIQNLQDISKTFTDFTQTFTIPTSKVNNGVFEHYYNNDVDAVFNAQNRQPARLEINNTIFRTGKVQLESSELKDNQSDSYKITFYGEIATLKDLFSDDKLSDLDYSSLAVEYDDATVVNAQTDLTHLDVRFPLISSNRIWEYGDASSADISTIPGKINYTELFPAVRDAKILELMEAKYGINFTGLFLTDQRFITRFTYWKNRKVPEFALTPVQILFNVGGALPNSDGIFRNTYIDPSIYAPTVNQAVFTTISPTLHLIPSVTATYWVEVQSRDIHETGTITEWTSQGNVIGGGAGISGVAGVQQSFALPTTLIQISQNAYYREYRYFLRSYSAVTLTGTFTNDIDGYYIQNNIQTTVPNLYNYNYPITSTSTTNAIDFASAAPDIKIADYFTGLLNTFNLTCFPTSNDLTFQLEPLDKWYKYGKDYNVTEYIDEKSIQIERIKLHKTISFEYQESKAFLNVDFKSNNNRNYGDLTETFDYDGGDFKIKLPFENLLFNKFTGTNLQVGFSMSDHIENAEKSIIPKCTGLYYDRAVYNVDFYLGASHMTSYLPFGQDNTSGGGTDYSLNFGSEYSTLKDTIIQNSLFLTYYHPYLTNLYNPKSRRVKVKAMFPLSFLMDITLDSKLIIRDKKYIIEEMKTNLTTGEVDLTLLSYLVNSKNRITGGGGVVPSSGVKPVVTSIPINANNQGLPQGYAVIDAPAETQFVTSTPTLPTTITTSTNFEFTVPDNTSGAERTNTIPIIHYNLDGTEQFTEYVVITQESDSAYLTGGGVQLLTNAFNNLTE
jgi:hypothetical protein